MAPEPHRLVADVDATFEQQVLDLAQRQRITDVHHHREADDLGRAVEITEGIVHRRRLRILARSLKPIYSDNAKRMLAAAKRHRGSVIADSRSGHEVENVACPLVCPTKRYQSLS